MKRLHKRVKKITFIFLVIIILLLIFFYWGRFILLRLYDLDDYFFL